MSISSINLSSLDGTNGWSLVGDNTNERSGYSVTFLGDINGDNIDDLLIGAPNYNSSRGRSYVVFGTSSGHSNINLSDLNGSNGFSILGEASNNQFGWSVAGHIDLNNDGINDLLIGAYGADTNKGRGYVIFGKSSGWNSSVSLSSLNGANGFRLLGENNGDQFGYSVASIGDVNGDQIDDLLIGANRADSVKGRSYVLFGKSSGWNSSINISSLNGANGFRLVGENNNDQSGWSVGGNFDVNNDGIDDLLIGAYGAESNKGRVYVVFGKSTGFNSSINLSSLNGANGFRLSGESAGDRVGYGVSGLGDINGDGIDDLLIGAIGTDSIPGKSYVVFGKSTGFNSSINVSSLDGGNGFRLSGESAGDRVGYSVAGIGDVNGDGIDDLLIGGYQANLSRGKSYIVFGRFGGWDSNINLSALDGTNGLIIEGENAGDQFGFSVSGFGDLNKDGISDVLIGAIGASSSRGKSYVISGIINPVNGDGDNNVLMGTTAADLINGGGGDDVITGGGGIDTINGDEGDDTVNISDLAFATINGGGGFDGLNLMGGGLVLDLTVVPQKITGMELINIDGTGSNTLILSGDSVGNLSGVNNVLYVQKGVDDVVDIGSGWTLSAPFYWGGSYYREYRGVNDAILRIQQSPTVISPTYIATTGSNLVNGVLGDDDLLLGTNGRDRLNGRDGNDVIVGKEGADIIFGGSQADTFVYEGYGDSLLNSMDRIVDFNQMNGDRFQFVPSNITNLFYAGNVTGSSLGDVIDNLYDDWDGSSLGMQSLGVDEGVFFKYGARSFLSINNNMAGFQVDGDLLIEVSGIIYKSGDGAMIGSLGISDYFLT